MVQVVFIAMNRAIFVKLSTITHILSFPVFVLGNPPTKSVDMESHFPLGMSSIARLLLYDSLSIWLQILLPPFSSPATKSFVSIPCIVYSLQGVLSTGYNVLPPLFAFLQSRTLSVHTTFIQNRHYHHQVQ